MTIRYIVRDIDTKGCDFLMWGDDDLAAAFITAQQAHDEGCEVEIVAMQPHEMDPHTRQLIGDQYSVAQLDGRWIVMRDEDGNETPSFDKALSVHETYDAAVAAAENGFAQNEFDCEWSIATDTPRLFYFRAPDSYVWGSYVVLPR